MMTKYIEKDKNKRINFLNEENSRKVLKTISHNLNLSVSLRLKANLSLSELPKNSSLSRIKNRCVLTGRGRFLIGKFNLSRLMIRHLARSGLIPGLRKSSW
jgi:small subunit ribosomal protein S14